MYNPKPQNPQGFKYSMESRFLWILGVWPVASDKSFFGMFYHNFSFIIIANLCYYVMCQAAYLWKNMDNIIEVTENICTTGMGMLNFLRILYIRFHQDKLKRIIKMFARDIWFNSSTHPGIFKDCWKQLRIFRYMATLNISLITTYCILPLIMIFGLGMFNGEDEEKPFPYKMVFPYSTNSSLSYGLTYFGSCIGGSTAVFAFFAGDALFGYYLVFTCGRFRILHQDIGRIFVNSKQRRKKINAIARKHQKLIEFCELLDNFHSTLFFGNFVFSTLLICMVGFQMVTGKNVFLGDYFKYALYICSLLSQLLVLCWNGDKIIQVSSETANAFYFSNWESHFFDKEQRIISKDIQFMITRSQKPIKITASRFSVLSCQTFTKIISTSMSYFTLLRTVVEV